MTNRKTMTKSTTSEHLKKSPARRRVDKKPDHGSTIRYVQGSLLDYLEASVADAHQREEA